MKNYQFIRFLPFSNIPWESAIAKYMISSNFSAIHCFKVCLNFRICQNKTLFQNKLLHCIILSKQKKLAKIIEAISKLFFGGFWSPQKISGYVTELCWRIANKSTISLYCIEATQLSSSPVHTLFFNTISSWLIFITERNNNDVVMMKIIKIKTRVSYFTYEEQSHFD